MIVAEWINNIKAERASWLQSMGKHEGDVEIDRETKQEFFFSEWGDDVNTEHLIRVFLPWSLQTTNLN